ncbi:MAG: type II toxin-antitoxin system prevent-host-death family antitoxin [Nitrococcus mobilis]|nr:type II toxin-antitoxin system prevent-host-death family antitoxin [Nitrococcus mobilis]
MDNTQVNLADAKARLSELAELAAAGETVVITKRGKPVVQLSRLQTPRKPVDLAALQQLTRSMPAQTEDAGHFMRRLRDEARY